MRVPEIRRLARDERGSALLEFALVAPVLLALTFGMIQDALLLFTWNNMIATAREASREMFRLVQ